MGEIGRSIINSIVVVFVVVVVFFLFFLQKRKETGEAKEEEQQPGIKGWGMWKAHIPSPPLPKLHRQSLSNKS